MLGICCWKIPRKRLKGRRNSNTVTRVGWMHCMHEQKKKYPKLFFILFKKSHFCCDLMSWGPSLHEGFQSCFQIERHVTFSYFARLPQIAIPKLKNSKTLHLNTGGPATSVPIFSFSSCFVGRVSLRSRRETLL